MSELDALLAGLRDRADALAKSVPAPEAAPVAVETPAVTETPAATEETVAKGGEAGAEAATTEAAEAAAATTEETTTETTETEGETQKSFEVTGPNGEKRQAIDGFALIKSLSDKLDGALAEIATLKAAEPVVAAEPVDVEGMQKSFDERTETMAKALATAMDALSAAHAQVGELTAKVGVQAEQIAAHGLTVKALSDKVTAFGATGRGRTSAVTVHEKPSAAAVQEQQQTVGDLFAKANALISAGKLSAVDAGRVNAWVNAGRGVPPEYAALFAA